MKNIFLTPQGLQYIESTEHFKTEQSLMAGKADEHHSMHLEATFPILLIECLTVRVRSYAFWDLDSVVEQ